MTNTAFIFPGQGSQEPAMLDPFADAWPTVRETIESIADDHLQTLLSTADADTLREPANTQQAVVATGLAVEQAVRARTGIEPALVAGHSVGHITAAAAAGALTPEAALSLVEERGRLMAMADRKAGPGTMVAVNLAAPTAVDAAIEPFESVSVAGYNSPKQTVISGPTADVTQALTAIDEQITLARTTELSVGSGFHSPVMEPAVDPFETVLDQTTIADPDIPIVSDVTGDKHRDGATIRTDLQQQLTAPINWTAVVHTLVENGIDRVLELPPAGTLTTLTERTSSELTVISLSSPAVLEDVIGDD